MNDNDQAMASNYMGALAHLLTGRADRHAEFIDKVQLILAGSEPDVMQLMQFTEQVRRGGPPVMWVHVPVDMPYAPSIGVVVADAGRPMVFENCVLWLPAAGGAACLIPDNFKMGAYLLDGDLRLRGVRKPVAAYEAKKGMIRAYTRLRTIECEQRERGDTFELPSLGRLQKAA